MDMKLCCLASEEHRFGPKICYITKKCFSFWEREGGGQWHRLSYLIFSSLKVMVKVIEKEIKTRKRERKK